MPGGREMEAVRPLPSAGARCGGPSSAHGSLLPTRSATVTAASAVTVLRLERDKCMELLGEGDEVGRRLPNVVFNGVKVKNVEEEQGDAVQRFFLARA